MTTLANSTIIEGPSGEERHQFIEQYLNHCHIERIQITKLSAPKGKKIIPIETLREESRSLYMTTQADRVLWIDDADYTLANASFQSLLKICEEPPSRGHILFAVESSQRLPRTLQSRSQVITMISGDEVRVKNLLKDHMNAKAAAFAGAVCGDALDKAKTWITYGEDLERISDLYTQGKPYNTQNIAALLKSQLPFEYLAAATLVWFARHKKSLPPEIHEHISQSKKLGMPDPLSKAKLLWILERA